jgi:peptidylprolyl isomerase/peptidyl-prolyl cis-trans isomerase D
MGVMNKLRESTGVILWILVFAFGVIWTLQDSNVFETAGQQTRNIAVVNDTPVPYEDYQRALNQQREQFRQRFGGELTPRMEDMVRQQTYDQMITQTLLEQEMDRLGIMVTDAEVEEMVYGPTPHPVIRQQFADSTGQVNYQLIDNLAQNPQMQQQWIQLEQFLREQRRQQKMNTMVRATVHISGEDIREYYHRQNDTTAVRYVALRYAAVPDDSVTVTQADLETYYENNKEDYKQAKTFTFDYATTAKEATTEDSASVAEDLRDLRDEFAAAENDSLFLAENASDRSYSAEYQTADQMEDAIADAVFKNLDPGAVVGPVFANDLAHLIKIQDTRPAEGTFVHARHILLRSQEDDPAKRERLEAVKAQIQTLDDFADQARQISEDGTAARGGDLGWFGDGRMVEAFEDAAFNGPTGEVIGPIKSEFGYHLIWVEARADQAVKMADLAYSLRPSTATLNEKENLMEDLAFYAEEGSFADEAQRLGLEVQQVEVEDGQSNIPGIGQSRSFVNFMDDAEEGAISSVIELDNKFVVLRVAGIRPEGYRPLEEVEAQVRTRVELQKKRAVQVRRMEQALRSEGFDGMARVLNTRIRTKDDITFATSTIPGLGREPAFVGAVDGLDVGETSGVMEGENAAFVVRVTGRDEAPALTDSRRAQIQQQLMRQRQQQMAQQWIASLRDAAEIEDNRSVFQQ